MSAILGIIAMSKTSSIPLPPAHARRKLGRDLALARRKRGISTSDMAARLFVSRDTLWRLERGDPTVALGTLATATFVLKLHDRVANLAAPASDELAVSLDERRLLQHIRRSRSWVSKSKQKGTCHGNLSRDKSPRAGFCALSRAAAKESLPGRGGDRR
jgi:transcriptional regulator with XRE-family HTH domain